MKTIKWRLSIGLAGCEQEGEFDVEDDATEEEIEMMAKEIIDGYLDWDWQEVK